MTTCPTCGQTHKGMVCTVCREARARAGMLLHQRRFLQTWSVGQIELRLARKDGQPAHVQLFDARWHAYCGATLFDIVPRAFVRDLPPDICPDCANVFHDLVARFVPKPA